MQLVVLRNAQESLITKHLRQCNRQNVTTGATLPVYTEGPHPASNQRHAPNTGAPPHAVLPQPHSTHRPRNRLARLTCAADARSPESHCRRSRNRRSDRSNQSRSRIPAKPAHPCQQRPRVRNCPVLSAIAIPLFPPPALRPVSYADACSWQISPLHCIPAKSTSA